MAKPMHSTFAAAFCCLFLVPITIPVMIFIPCLVLVESATLESDIEALRSLKQTIDPNTIPASSFLSTWDFQVDPCESSGGHFLGILCTVPVDNSSSCSRVSAIDLHEGEYDGFLSPEIGNLTELTTLDLSKNKFRRPIPTTISNLQKLTRLSLSENFFTGNLPPRIDRLKRLEVMDVSHNELSGSIPRMISTFRSLTLLRLSNNRFTGRIPDLTGLWQLNTLDLSRNHLSGNLPQLPVSLRTLLLGHNTLSGHISPLLKLKNLQASDLSDNRFSGSISHDILTLPNLNLINVSFNSFSTMEVIKYSEGATQLRVLDVHGNRLQGHLPVNLVTYENLTAINLGNNQFSGRIPVEYWQKLGQAWRSLFLDHNFLVGSLPPQFINGTAASSSIRGSLAQNCLNCPGSFQLCRGGQRPVSQCVGQNGIHKG